MRKLLTLLMAIVISTISASAYDFMVNGLCYNENSDGTSVTVTYERTSSPRYSNLSGDLAIPESVTYSGKTYSVTSIGNEAFRGCSGLTSVDIPNSVTLIPIQCFIGCSSLTSVTIPSSVTKIDIRAFYGCTGLTSVTIPNSVTEIGENAFYDTPWFDNQPDGMVYAGMVAYEYKGIMPNGTSIVLINGCTGIADGCFLRCTGLTSVTIGNSVTSIGVRAFSGCSGLTSVTIPNSVTTIGSGAFENCTSLTSMTIPNSVTKIPVLCFEGCSGLTSVTIPNSVTAIGWQASGVALA